MRYPEFLKEKGRIAFIAPSFGCTTEPYRTLFDATLIRLKNDGYRTILGPNCYASDGIGKSSSPLRCGREINDFFCEDKSDVIISCGGGELMCEDLDFVDFRAIADSKAKWYMGYSDNTNLTFLLNTLCDTASIYGPNAPKLANLEGHKSIEDAHDMLRGRLLSVDNYDGWYLESESDEEDNDGEHKKEYELVAYEQTIYIGDNKCDEAVFDGRLLGGCMDCLTNLVGTKYDKVREFAEKYKDDGIVWFIEACDFSVMDIRRALWQMESAGWFENAKGFLIGRPLNFYDRFGDFDHIEAVKGILSKYNLPIVMDIDLGHLFPAMPVISGSVANITAKNNSIHIDYNLI